MRTPEPPDSPPGSDAPRFTTMLLVGMFAVCVVCGRWPAVMSFMGVGHGPHWFSDAQAVLRAIAAYRHGVEPNGIGEGIPLHFYSHWWFALAPLELSRFDTWWVGFLIVGAAIATIAAVVRPRTGAELAFTLAVFASAPIVLGLNRANVDLLFFALLSACVPAVQATRRTWRIFGPAALVALGTGLKYYPAVGGLLLLAVRPARDRRWAIAMAVLLITLAALSVIPDLGRYASEFAAGGTYTFGARTLGQLTGQRLAGSPLLAAILLAGIGWTIHATTSLRSWRVPPQLRRDHLHFVLGAVILTGCFALTINYAYRFIFVFSLLPFLLRVRPEAGQVAVRRLRLLTVILLFAALWFEAAITIGLSSYPQTEAAIRSWYRVGTALVHGVHWGVFACLSAWLVNYVQASWRAEPERSPAG